MNNFTIFKIKYLLLLLLIVSTTFSFADTETMKNHYSLAQIIAQKKVTLKFVNKPLVDVLKSIQKQSGVDFVIHEEIRNAIPFVTIDVKDVSVEAALNNLLRESGYSYKIVNNLITFVKIVNASHENKKVALRNVIGSIGDKL